MLFVNFPAADMPMSGLQGNDEKLYGLIFYILLEIFVARDPPPAVMYLDCEKIQGDSYSLKWCLP